MSDRQGGPPRAVRIDSWGFEHEVRSPRSGVSLFGLFLILVGVLLALDQFVPAAKVGASAFFLAVGIVLLLAWARDRSHLALYAGTFVTALSLANLLTDLNVISGPGWGWLFVGLGFLVIAAIRAAGHAGVGWQLILGAIMALYGAAQVGAHGLGFDADRLVGPALIVVLGLLILANNRRPRPY